MKDNLVIPIIPAEVLNLFGASGEVTPLSGGQGMTFRCGNIVFKPCSNPVEWKGLAQLLTKLRPIGYRIVKPIRALDGRWEVEGWMATHLVEGWSGFQSRELEALSACRCFHQELSIVYNSTKRPEWLGHSSSVYSKADQLAWGDCSLSREFSADVKEILKPIVSTLSPIPLQNQITHGDPGGDNILFAENQAPAIIDVSPYWRPSGYAIAMMLADGIAWEGSALSVLEFSHDEPYFGQLLLRAVLFRLIVSSLCKGYTSLVENVSAYGPITQWAFDQL